MGVGEYALDARKAGVKLTPAQAAKLTLPTGSAARKNVPMATGVLDYFPAALAAVAALSKAGNDKHNPGEPLHHARGKSTDHADCILRHLVDRGTVDPEDGIRHSVKVAWRALALVQEELEAAGEAPLARGARLPAVTVKLDAPSVSFDMPEAGAALARFIDARVLRDLAPWHPWCGGDNPVPGRKVEVRFGEGVRGGVEYPSDRLRWHWISGGRGGDITAYRVV